MILYESQYYGVQIMDFDPIVHHGIKGQKWGVTNGPPYPLGFKARERVREKAKQIKARLSGNKSSSGKKRGLSNKTKARIKTGLKVAGTAAVVGAAAYGAYKLSELGVVDKSANLSETIRKPASNAEEFVQGLKKLSAPESLQDSLSLANPYRGTPEGANNCSVSAVAGFMRRNGFDVTAMTTGGKQQILGGVIEDAFKGARVIDGSAIKFGRSPKDASEMLVNKFGQNASGCCSIQWKPGSPFVGGHAFNWEIKDGNVSFMDYQGNRDHATVTKYWQFINQNDSLTLARLDNAEINFENIKKYVKSR